MDSGLYFFGAKSPPLYSSGIRMNCCFLAFVAGLYADSLCFVPGCFFFIIFSHGCN